MSDTTSECSSELTESYENLSICQEIDELIDNCNQLHERIYDSFETLHSIKELIDNNTNIIVVSNDRICDFDEILEELHATALESIDSCGKNTFGQSLLNFLETAKFQ